MPSKTGSEYSGGLGTSVGRTVVSVLTLEDACWGASGMLWVKAALQVDRANRRQPQLFYSTGRLIRSIK